MSLKRKTITLQTKDALEQMYEFTTLKYGKTQGINISEIYESRISFSFRVFMNGASILFYQNFKEQ